MFAALLVPPKTARAAGVVVVVERPLEAFTAVPANAESSVEEAHELEPWVPFKYKTPVPTFALN